VRLAEILSAASAAAGSKPAGHTDWKSMFLIRLCRDKTKRNIGILPVRLAEILSAASAAAGSKPAGHTDWKSMFR